MCRANDRVKLLEYRSIDLLTRSRRHNLVFQGFPETREDENCEAVVKTMIADKLKIDSRNMFVQRAQRLGVRRRDSVALLLNQDLSSYVFVLINSRTLRCVYRDYPKEIANARSELWSRYKEEKKRKTRQQKSQLGSS